MMWRTLQRAAAAFVPLLGVLAADLATTAQHKLDTLENGSVKRGSIVDFSTAEVNAWARVKVPEAVPKGIRNIDVQFGTGTAIASALVNFLEMQHAKGKEPGRLMAWILSGERPLKVNVRVQSGNGRCTVYLTRVELSGVVMSGSTLDFVIQNFFRPLYPDAHINEPFELADNIDRIDFVPAGIRVGVKR